MFTFTEEELSLAPHMASTLIPPHMRTEQSTVPSTTESKDPAPANPSTATEITSSQNENESQPRGNNESSFSAANALPSTSEEGGA